MSVIIDAKTKHFKQKKTCSFKPEQKKILFKEKNKTVTGRKMKELNPSERLHSFNVRTYNSKNINSELSVYFQASA